MRNIRMQLIFVLILFFLCTNCASHTHILDGAFHTHADKFNGLPGIQGESVEYQKTSVWALHALWLFPLIGDARLENAVNQFSAEAKERGATGTNIEETDSFTYWFVFPPFSFLVHPVNTTIGGNIEGTTKNEKKEDRSSVPKK